MQEDQWEKPLVQEGVGPSITLKTTAVKMEPTLLIALLYNRKMYKPNTGFLHNENIWGKRKDHNSNCLYPFKTETLGN